MNERRVLLFWIPLAVMWVMMGIEQPAIAAAVGRLDEPIRQLAAFGVTFSLGLLIESPVIQLLSTGTALAVDLDHYRTILRYTHVMAISLAAIHAVIAVTPLFDLIVIRLLGVPPEVVEPSRKAFVLMIPWAPAIAYRRFFQGVLIRYGRTRVVPVTMISRVGVIALVLVIALTTRALPGATVGAISLSLGVIAAAVAAWVFVRPVVRRDIPREAVEEPLTPKRFFSFYAPLAMTSFVALAARSLLTLGIARAPQALESLAVWPVLTAFIFMVNSMALAYQEVVISLAGVSGSRKALEGFTIKLALALTTLLAVAVVTPFDDWWLFGVSGLEESLRGLTRLPMLILMVTPVFVTAISWYRGLSVYRRRTLVITQAVVINTSTLMIVVLLLAALAPLSGVLAAAIAYTTALGIEALFLHMRSRPGGAEASK